MLKVIDKKIMHLLPYLGKEEKKSILDIINSYVNLKKSTLSDAEINEYNLEIDRAMKRMDLGKFTNHKSVEIESLEW